MFRYFLLSFHGWYGYLVRIGVNYMSLGHSLKCVYTRVHIPDTKVQLNGPVHKSLDSAAWSISWTHRTARSTLLLVFVRNHWPTGSGWVGGCSASDQQSTNDRKVTGSRPTKLVCITVLTGNRMGWTALCGRPLLLLPSCRKLGV